MRMKTFYRIAGAALFAASAHVALAQDEAAARQLTPAQMPYSQITVPVSAMQVSAWLDRSQALYRPGEQARLFVRVSQPAYLTVLNVDASGATTVIFPNKFEPNGFVSAPGVVKIPADAMAGQYALWVGEPYGANLIKIFATSANVPVVAGAAYAGSNPFMTVGADPAAVAAQIQKLAGTPSGGQWAASEVVFGVVPGAGASAGPAVAGAPAVAPGAAAAPAAGDQALQAYLATLDLKSEFGLTVEGQANYRAGEEITLEVTPESDCELGLIDVDATGKPTVLFPNAITPKVKLKGGKVNFVPSRDNPVSIKAQSPGSSALIAVCSHKPGFWEQIARRDGDGSRGAGTAAASTATVADVLNNSSKYDVAKAVVRYSVN